MSMTLNKRPKTVFMPVTIMEEVPVLSPADRAELVASLHQAEADIASGNFVTHDPQNFVSDMTRHRSAALTKKAV